MCLFLVNCIHHRHEAFTKFKYIAHADSALYNYNIVLCLYL